MFGVTVLPSLIVMRMSGGSKHLVVAATDRQTAELIREQLGKPVDDGQKDDSYGNRDAAVGSRYEVEIETDTSDSQRAALSEKVTRKQLDGVIWATDDALAASKITYITRDVSSLIDREVVRQGVSRAAHRRLLQKRGLNDTEIDSALRPVAMETFNPMGTGPSNPLTTFLA